MHDSSHSPVVGASVSGQWSGDYTGSASCTTDPSGSCIVRTAKLTPPATTTFTVTSITYVEYSYDGDINHDPDGDSNGTSITVSF